MENNFFKIGEAVRILKKEYENLTASMLRYWDQKGVVEASEKTEGGQRVYRVEDLDLIRYARELSISGCSLGIIRKAIKETKLVAKTPKYSAESFRKALIKLIRALRAFNKLERRLEVHNQQSLGERFEPIYDREALVKLSGDPASEKIIDKAEKYNLIFPGKSGKKKRYSRADEVILRYLLLMGISEIKKFKNLYDIIKYLEEEVGVTVTVKPGKNFAYFLLPGVRSQSFTERIATPQDRLFQLLHDHYDYIYGAVKMLAEPHV